LPAYAAAFAFRFYVTTSALMFARFSFFDVERCHAHARATASAAASARWLSVDALARRSYAAYGDTLPLYFHYAF